MHLCLSVLSLALAASSSVALSFDNAPHPSLDKPSNAIKARQIGRESPDRAGPARLDNGRMDHSGNLAAGDQLRQLLESLGNNGRLAINGNRNDNAKNGAMDHDGTARVIIIAQGNGEHDQQRGDGRGRGGNRGNNDDDRDRGRGRGGREDGPGRNRGGNDDRRGGGRIKGKDNIGVGVGGDASAINPPRPPPPALGTDASAIIDASAIVDASAVDPPARPTAVPFRPSAAAPPAPPAAINGTDASAIVDASATAIDPAAGKPAPPTALPAAVAGEKKGKVQAKVRHGVESRRRGKRNTPPHA